MLRSLPPGRRIIPATLFAIFITVLLYKVRFSKTPSSVLLSPNQCDLDGNCETDLTRPPSRAEFHALQETVNSIKKELEDQKYAPPEILTPDELLWESRREECGKGVERNIDYQHVLFPNLSANDCRASHMRNSGHRLQKVSGLKKPIDGNRS